MKKLWSMVLVVALICMTALAGCSGNTDSGVEVGSNGELKIFNWGEYISDGTDGSLDLIKEFEQTTGIKVTAYDTFDSNEQMYAKLKSGTVDYDIIIPSDYMISRLIEEDMLEKINYENIPNYSQIIDSYKGSALGYDPTDEYSVPYTWGTVGIIYNEPMIEELTGKPADEVVTGWDAFWNEDLKDNMFMFINSRDSFGIGELYLGKSLNETDPTVLEQVADALKQQKPLVQAYVMDEMFDKMENGEAAISPAYAGDIITMMASNEDLNYCFPKEGSNIFVDAVCIPKGAQNQENAEKFINFLCDPEMAKENIEYICYSTPNEGALELLDADLRNNKIAYPPQDILDRCEAFLHLPSETNELMENLWVEIRK